MGTAWGHQAPGLDAEDSPGLSWFLMDLGMVAVTFSSAVATAEFSKFAGILEGESGE